MAGIHDLAVRLGKALKETPECRAFQEAYKRAKTDPKAEKLLSELQRRQSEVALQQAQGQKPDPEKVKELENLARSVKSHPVTREYLEAASRYQQLWNEVNAALFKAMGGEPPKTPGG